jgi:hypothetical protein
MMFLIFCLNTLVAKIYRKITLKKKKEVVSENALDAQTSSFLLLLLLLLLGFFSWDSCCIRAESYGACEGCHIRLA